MEASSRKPLIKGEQAASAKHYLMKPPVSGADFDEWVLMAEIVAV